MPRKSASQRKQERKDARDALRKDRMKDLPENYFAMLVRDVGPRLEAVGDGTKQTMFEILAKRWGEFINETFPDQLDRFEACLAHNAFVEPTYGELSGFMLWWGRKTAGQEGAGPNRDQTPLETMLLRWATFLAYYRAQTGLKMHSDMTLKVCQYIRDEDAGLVKILNLCTTDITQYYGDMPECKEAEDNGVLAELEGMFEGENQAISVEDDNESEQ